MAFRRNIRTPVKRFKRRRAPLRTHGVKETKWSTSRFVATREFNFDGEASMNVDMVVLNPKFMFELTIQPTTQTLIPIINIAPLINQAQATRGVKIGGIVWDSGFHLNRNLQDAENAYVNAYAQCIETLWTRRVDEDGFPTDTPPMNATWRPLRVDDSVFDPTENAGDLVRIHHTRYALLGVGNNAAGSAGQDPVEAGVSAFGAASATWTQPGWGGTRSLRMRKFIADDQQLSFNLVVTNPNTSATTQQNVVWTCMATVYWATQNQR